MLRYLYRSSSRSLIKGTSSHFKPVSCSIRPFHGNSAEQVSKEDDQINEEQTTVKFTSISKESEIDPISTSSAMSDSEQEKIPKKPTKIKFEKTIDHELFQTHISSRETEEAADILKKFSGNNEYVVATRTYNVLLDTYFKQNEVNKALDLWKEYRIYGIRPSPRSFSLMFNGLIKNRRSVLLPDFMEQFEKSKIRSERLLADRYYRKETSRIPYTLSNPKSVDPRICLKLPPKTPLPDGSFPNINNLSDEKKILTTEQRQLESEQSCVDKSVQDYIKSAKQLSELKRAATMSPGRKLMTEWFSVLRDQIENQQGSILLKLKNNEKVDLHLEYLTKLSSDKLSVIAMHEIISNVMANPSGALYRNTCLEIGKAVEAEIQFATIKKEMTKRQVKYIEKKAFNTHQRTRAINRHLGQNNIKNNNNDDKDNKKNISSLEKEDFQWSNEIRLKLGGTLVALTIDNTYITGAGVDDYFDYHKSPAFEHSYIQTAKNKSQGVIIGHPEVLNQLDPQENQHVITPYAAKLMPMYMSPQPWTKSRNGPYLKAKTQMMRTYSRNQEKTLKTTDLHDICELLTILGKLPWRINTRVYDVVKESWERGGNYPYVPNRNPVRAPTPPVDFRENPESRLLWRQEQNKTKRKNNERFSLRCDFLLKLKTAEKLVKEDAFFFPHNMDFRGRCYPIPPHLNHIGSDVCRGLLQFAEGKPLGTKGLYWLKAHIASLCGVNKVSFDDRVKYTEAHIDDIIDSAENPLDGNRWWLEADDAWQCLSCCFELRDALRMKDPTKYISHTPIHMDGSCNGLQHYAALGGDIDGGRSVNLLPADKPQDVYTHVLNIVVNRIEEDAANGLEIAQKVVGKIIRKTIKQTVMTSVYGVTYIGARCQIAGQLKDQEAIPDEDLFEASVYVTKITFGAMQTMFTGARQIMAWLGDTARTVSRTGSTMAWVTPIGIPVEQHYRRPGRLQVKTLLQSVILCENSDDLPVLVQKQRSAFPPNYVHSLDSTHMFKTAKKCYDSGIAFAAVHDSFWTHASTVDEMNLHLRNAFVELHSRPLLEELREHIVKLHPTIELTPYPERGPLNIKEVLNSRYFFH